MTQQTLKLLEDAEKALYEAEQAVRKEEGADVNAPMYRMRQGLTWLIWHYKSGSPICGAVTNAEYIIHSYLKQFPNI